MDTRQEFPQASTPTWWTTGLIAWAVGSVVVLGVLYAVYVSNAGLITVPQSMNGTLELTGVPGDVIRLEFFHSRSQDGEWGSHDGISLTLTRPEPAVEHSWRLVRPGHHDECRGSDGCSDSFRVRASVTVPDSVGPEPQDLTGRLSGGIQFQSPSTTVYGSEVQLSRTATGQLDKAFSVPVRLRVVLPGEGTTSGAKERNDAEKNVWTVMALNVASFAALWSFLFLRSGYIDVQRSGTQPLRLLSSPGDRIRLRLFEGKSAGGAWGTDSGLSMFLCGSPAGGRTVIPIVQPKPLSVSDTEVSSFAVDGVITTPTHAGTYTGRLIGDIAYRLCKGTGAISKESLDIPTILEVDPNGVTSGKYGSGAWITFRIGLVIDAVFIVWLLATVLV